MRYQIKHLLAKVLAHTGWSQNQLSVHLGCGKNSLKTWLERGAPYYIVLALEHTEEETR